MTKKLNKRLSKKHTVKQHKKKQLNKKTINKNKKGGNRENTPVTIKTNVPETLQWNNPNQTAPEPQYQGGIYTGPQAYGPWGVIPVTPTTSNIIHNNLDSASPPPGGNIQYPGTNHLGNNYSSYPGIEWYNDTTSFNPGPFRIKGTTCPSNNTIQKGGVKIKKNGKKQSKNQKKQLKNQKK